MGTTNTVQQEGENKLEENYTFKALCIACNGRDSLVVTNNATAKQGD